MIDFSNLKVIDSELGGIADIFDGRAQVQKRSQQVGISKLIFKRADCSCMHHGTSRGIKLLVLLVHVGNLHAGGPPRAWNKRIKYCK